MENQRTCPNCKTLNLESDSFCRNCSQKVHLGLNSVWRMISEFFTNIINYDSKLFSTLRGLFFPGFLTEQYLAKKRVPYLTPMRLFVFLMFALFAIVSIQGFEKLGINFSIGSVNSNTQEHAKTNNRIDNREYSLLELADPGAKTLGLLESLEIDIENNIEELANAKIIEETIESISTNHNVPEATKNQIKEQQQQDTMVSFKDLKSSSDLVKQIRGLLKIDENETLSLTLFMDRKLDIEIKDIFTLTEDQIIEKYKVSHWFEKILTKQMLKFNKDSASFGKFLFQNLTWAIFLEVLLMAMIFKLFYIRQKRMYVEHFIYHLHLRSFVFINAILLLLVPIEIPLWIMAVISLWMVIYIIISLIKVYQQSVIMTLLKGFIFTVVEFFIILISISLVMIISSLLYQ